MWSCPTCGQEVADEEVDCASCKRRTAKAPPQVEAAREQLRITREKTLTAGPKECAECGADVRFDDFRLKTDEGRYLCSDCQDEEDEAIRRRAMLMRTWTGWIVVMLLIGALVVGALSLSGSLGSFRKGTAVKTE